MKQHATTLINKINNSLLLRPVRDKFFSIKGIGPMVITGGCLRDIANDKPVKDIDIVMHNDEFWKVVNALGIVNDFEGGHTYNHKQLRWQTELNIPGIKVPVNFLIWKDEHEITLASPAEYNDFGICQISFDFEKVYATQLFLDDCMNETFTLTRAGWDVNRSLARYKRLTEEKYQGWKLNMNGIEVPQE